MIPSFARRLHIGLSLRKNDSKQCEKASNAVALVMFFGSDKVSVGSKMVKVAYKFWWKIVFFRLSISVYTHACVHCDPVPDVVGIAIIGNLLLISS